MATVTEPCIELAVVEKMTSDLCNALPIDDLFPSMISNRVIDFNDKADIRAERTERRRVEYFLDKYLTKGLNLDTTRFYRFLKVLEGSPKCDFLVTRIKRCMEECKEELDKSTGKGINAAHHNTSCAGGGGKGIPSSLGLKSVGLKRDILNGKQ